MVAKALTWGYRRLGRFYPRVFMAVELQTAYLVILGTYALFGFYYASDSGTFFTLFGLTRALAAIAIAIACVKTFPLLRPVVIPASVLSVVLLDLNWYAVFPFVAGSMVALGYSSMLHYFALEIGLRPVLVDINQRVSPRTERSLSALPLRWRLLLTRLVPEPEPEPIAAAAGRRISETLRARDGDR